MNAALTAPEHQGNTAVEEAARWLAEQPPGNTKPTVPTLQSRFGISTAEALEAIGMAGRMRMLRSAHG